MYTLIIFLFISNLVHSPVCHIHLTVELNWDRGCVNCGASSFMGVDSLD